MSAHQQMKRKLDELMGTRRNGEDVRQEKLHFTSPRVCKNFLLYCCPHDILQQTRCDLGACPRVHNVALRADYENDPKKDDYDFYPEALQHIQKFVIESDRRTLINKKRLAETQQTLTAEEAIRLDKIHKIVEKIGEALAKAEQLGAKGDVEESLKMMEAVDAFKKEKEDAEEEYRNAIPASMGQQQKLRVCEVCSSFLGLNDNDKRLADHFNGRMHLGFLKIREKLKELENSVEESHIKKFLDEEFKKRSENQVIELENMIHSPKEKSEDQDKHRSHRSESKPSHRSSRKNSHSPKEKTRYRSRSREDERILDIPLPSDEFEE